MKAELFLYLHSEYRGRWRGFADWRYTQYEHMDTCLNDNQLELWSSLKLRVLNKKMPALSLKGTLVRSIRNKTTIKGRWCYHVQKVHLITKCPQLFNLVKRKHKFSAGVVAILLSQAFHQHKGNRAVQGEGNHCLMMMAPWSTSRLNPCCLPNACQGKAQAHTSVYVPLKAGIAPGYIKIY